VTVNFENKFMQFGSSAQFLLRRLSTPSYTKWVWYWKDDDGWKKYAKTRVDTILLLLLFKTEGPVIIYRGGGGEGGGVFRKKNYNLPASTFIFFFLW